MLELMIAPIELLSELEIIMVRQGYFPIRIALQTGSNLEKGNPMLSLALTSEKRINRVMHHDCIQQKRIRAV